MAKPKVTLHSREIDKLLKSPDVQKELKRRTEAAARAAGEGFDSSVTVGNTRALGKVYAATADANRRNSRDHTLMRAMDQMRR